jgi:hypothetical protein
MEAGNPRKHRLGASQGFRSSLPNIRARRPARKWRETRKKPARKLARKLAREENESPGNGAHSPFQEATASALTTALHSIDRASSRLDGDFGTTETSVGLMPRASSDCRRAGRLRVRMLRTPTGFSRRPRCALNGPFEETLTKLGTRTAKQQSGKNRRVERNPTDCNNTQK